ncbi:hypothetical protein X772_02595 [Mesorhizobium sp. LSJC280B00]|nr:hypothetical protein X772_02595 [Mesorhizobium sp. LSJC280B00]
MEPKMRVMLGPKPCICPVLKSLPMWFYTEVMRAMVG